MATILSISASPSVASKSTAVRRVVDEGLALRGHRVHSLDVRDLPPAALLGAESILAERFDLVTGAVTMTRPLYSYPAVPRCSGQGDPDSASSFVRATEA